MKNKMLLATGVAAGYVLGAKAGRPRYEQIKRLTTRFVSNPRVQNTAVSIGQQAGQTAGKVGGAVGSKVGEVVSDHMPEKLGGSPSSSGTSTPSSTTTTGIPSGTGTGYPATQYPATGSGSDLRSGS